MNMRNWLVEKSIMTAKAQQIRETTIMEATTDLVATVDVDGFILKLNGAGYDILELKENADINHLRLVGFYTKESASNFIKIDTPSAVSAGASHSEINLITCNGTVIPSSQVLIAQKGILGDVEYFSVILRDIRSIKEAENERKTLLEQLHQSKKTETVGRLAGCVAHDFNNFMTVIMGNAELALLDIENGNSAKNQLKAILDSAQQAARLSTQLLEFSSKKLIKPQILNLNEVLGASQQLMESILGKDIEIKVTGELSLWPIKIDRSQLEQIILNLSVNSRDAMNRNGTFSLSTENIFLDAPQAIKLGLKNEGAYVKFTVSDNGCGIEQGFLEQIFDPFFTTKDKGKGTGLGLSTVYGAIIQNEGQIHVRSTVGEGTCFEIYFPKDESNAQILQIKPENNNNVRQIFGKESILLVDDNEEVREMLSKFLKGLGYSVFEAGDGIEAFKIYKQNSTQINLVVSDVVMPNMNGMELYRELIKLEPEIKYVLMSGHTEKIISRDELSQKNISFISKPFPVRSLVEVVRDVLNHSEKELNS